MIRTTWKPVLALSAVLASCASSSADDRDTRPLFGGSNASGTTMTLGGKGTAEQAATEDNELTGGRHYGGYRGWGGGYGGYRGYYGGGYRGYYGGYYGGYRGYYTGYRGYYGGYRPYYSSYYSFGYRPAYYAPQVYYSGYTSYPVYSTYYNDCSPSVYLGIGGGAGTGAPSVTLGASFARPPATATQPMAQPAAPGDGTFPYDGGPANPVPLPKADPQTIPPASPSAATDLPISLKPKAASSPYKYKAYGEK